MKSLGLQIIGRMIRVFLYEIKQLGSLDSCLYFTQNKLFPILGWGTRYISKRSKSLSTVNIGEKLADKDRFSLKNGVFTEFKG